MIKKIKTVFWAIGMSIVGLTSAHADVFEDTFRDFTSCDATMFRTLYREAATWSSVAPLESRGSYSWIKVKNRQEDRDNHIDFTNPPAVSGLKLLSFFDEVSDLDSMGLYYYWGFIVSGTADDVVQKLKPLISSAERLRSDSGSYVRTEVKAAGSRWLPLATSSNTPTGVRKIERVFLIEPLDGRKDVVRVICSLQGGVTADVLKEARPDIDPKDHPKQVPAVLFDDVQIPENVAKTIKGINWTPKFKKLSYTYSSKKAGSQSESPVTVEIEAQEGLVRVNEIYSSSFNVQRLMLAGLVQLKSRMNGSGDRVYLTTDLKMSLPATFKKGAKLNVFKTMEARPPKMGDKEMSVSILCEVTEEVAAETIFPSLAGRAFKLSCTSDKKYDISTRVFLEDLNITVALDGKGEFGDWTYRLLKFAVER